GLDGQLGPDLVELPLERPGEVGNLEVDPRMDRVEVPGTGRGNGQNRRTHRGCSFSLAWIYLQLQALYRLVVAYASTSGIRRRGSSPAARGSRAAEWQHTGGLGLVPARPRHAHASPGGRSRAG